VTSADEIVRRLTEGGFLLEIEATSPAHVSVFIYERFKRGEGRSAYAANLSEALNLASARLAEAVSAARGDR
jgi:hypothetical protein